VARSEAKDLPGDLVWAFRAWSIAQSLHVIQQSILAQNLMPHEVRNFHASAHGIMQFAQAINLPLETA